MTLNVLDITQEITWIAVGAFALFLFGLTVALPHRPKRLPGSSGHRAEGDEAEQEEIHPDGYIDSFAGVIEEAGGGLPPVVALAVPTIILWWLFYLIFNWTPR